MAATSPRASDKNRRSMNTTVKCDREKDEHVQHELLHSVPRRVPHDPRHSGGDPRRRHGKNGPGDDPQQALPARLLFVVRRRDEDGGGGQLGALALAALRERVAQQAGGEVGGEVRGEHPDRGAQRRVGAPGEREAVGDAGGEREHAGGERERAARGLREEEGGPRARAEAEREGEPPRDERWLSAGAPQDDRRGRREQQGNADEDPLRGLLRFQLPAAPFRGLIWCVAPALDLAVAIGACDRRHILWVGIDDRSFRFHLSPSSDMGRGWRL
ncbi:hypothetical protein SETIT_2G231700v2 [Setaria italica]|uniref:Uncharacterized protein n=1 Tax=Setaria italica TaxID=4555 RepID=A0A368Q286_SETIT|nr:hypothetical protein SETIT_2G231700v2 [Setaria italica]